ncbi:MAG: cobalt ECF transporter T component CbiQ [Deltaproteobacteria bacterium]|nr:cobalt ECF transporter T component CbiQ [Deltaproteobacteria bacterium]MBW2137785.1 cobalt ECF transporter T component CbiQ [Deltaproteobacteria bacterium]
MIQEAFVDGDSFIHRLDPRGKIIIASFYSAIVAICDRFEALMPAIVITLTVVFFARISPKKLMKRIVIVNGFVLFLWLFLPFSTKGHAVFAAGPLVVSKEGLLYSALITLKSNIIIMTVLALIATSSIFTLGRALDRLFCPSKLVILIFFTYRYVHVIYQEYMGLAQAAKIRGFRPGNNLHTYKTYAYLVGMVLVKSHDRAERVRAAMLCRGFNGKFYDLSEFSFGQTDLWALVLMLLAVSSIAVLEWGI